MCRIVQLIMQKKDIIMYFLILKITLKKKKTFILILQPQVFAKSCTESSLWNNCITSACIPTGTNPRLLNSTVQRQFWSTFQQTFCGQYKKLIPVNSRICNQDLDWKRESWTKYFVRKYSLPPMFCFVILHYCKN